ncbi:hypothetical protein DM01DRAFT_1405332 [Hesseltinella vesiculosa]|uniref:RED-like N-terminal domain-containing protein n=1 Tax=Hesseltinella vesiculosa TaxID=101127 RepID=A0A1X2GPL5_9FUNG|nr:hypothetical protein DM01DRAFT_1405332 [Hesseltinella vesiculosa]
MNDEGLTQEDFRKLLQTPRPDAGASQPQRFKAPAPKSKRNEGQAVFAKPAVLRNKKKAPADGSTEQDTMSNYRDRAAERRADRQDDDTAEDLLRPMDEQDTLDAQQVYEQSKYLGGDVEHTHLVKGLDFALLNKVRQQLAQEGSDLAEDSHMDDALDDVLDKIDRGEAVASDDAPVALGDDTASMTAKALHQLFQPADTVKVQPLFRPGRMALLFPVLDINEDRKGRRRLQTFHGDPFAIPTSVIRSKADLDHRQIALELSGWSEQARNEALMISAKVTQVMKRHHQPTPTTSQPRTTGPSSTPSSATSHTPASTSMQQDNAVDDDDLMIFGDAGSDYVLDVAALQGDTKSDTASTANYFSGQQEQDEIEAQQVQPEKQDKAEDDDDRKRKFDDMVEMVDDDGDVIDMDSNDIDMFGLGSGALPTSFKDHHRMVVLDEDQRTHQPAMMVDQGTNRNKKAQLSRWDFDNEEEWEKYKSTLEIQPKSAAQFGVKAADGRKRNKERRVMDDKQKLNRDYQQVKNLMDKKYGK